LRINELQEYLKTGFLEEIGCLKKCYIHYSMARSNAGAPFFKKALGHHFKLNY